jgi:hypothetical protein
MEGDARGTPEEKVQRGTKKGLMDIHPKYSSKTISEPTEEELGN